MKKVNPPKQMTPRLRSITRLVGIAFLLGIAFTLLGSVDPPLVFVHITDTHVGTEKAADHLRRFLADVETIQPAPKFVVHSGDLTDMGSEAELRAYLDLVQQSPIPIYAVPGNHETRWSNVGKKRFERLIGPRYWHRAEGDVHLFGLDTSMLTEQYGHFDRPQLNWLEGELAKLPSDATVIPLVHHPPLHGSSIDNAAALIARLRGVNVPIFLTGHGHSTRHWRANGIDFVMTEGLIDDDWGYRIIEIGPDSVRVFLRILADTTLRLDFARPRRRRSPPERVIQLPDTVARIAGRFVVEVRSPAVTAAALRLDGIGDFRPMDRRGSGRFTAAVSLAPLPPGGHTVEVRVHDLDGEPWRFWRRLWLADSRERPLFTFEAGAGIQSSPVLSGHRLLFGANDGVVYAIDVRDGSEIWRYDAGGAVLASPTVADSVVVVGSLAGDLLALDLESGQLLWRRRIAESIYSSAWVSGDRLFVGASDSTVYALGLEDGRLLWRFRTKGLVKARPLVHNGRVYFGSWDRFFYAVDAEDGRLVWKAEISPNPYFPAATSNPVLAGGRIVVASHDHVVHAFDPETGQEVWRHEKTESRMPGYSTGLVVGDRLFFGSLSGHLFALDVTTGETRLEAQLGDPADPVFDSSPVWTGKHAVVGSIGGRVYAVDPESAEVAWTYALGDGFIFTTLAAGDGRLFVGTMAGRLWALSIPAP